LFDTVSHENLEKKVMSQTVIRKQNKDKLIFVATIMLLLYFLFMIATTRLPFGETVMVGVIREQFDLPAFALEAIFLVLSVITFTKKKFKLSYPFYSILVLLLNLLLLMVFIKN
jgi:hypothetical protein